jgi:hypothetical protein
MEQFTKRGLKSVLQSVKFLNSIDPKEYLRFFNPVTQKA